MPPGGGWMVDGVVQRGCQGSHVERGRVGVIERLTSEQSLERDEGSFESFAIPLRTTR